MFEMRRNVPALLRSTRPCDENVNSLHYLASSETNTTLSMRVVPSDLLFNITVPEMCFIQIDKMMLHTPSNRIIAQHCNKALNPTVAQCHNAVQKYSTVCQGGDRRLCMLNHKEMSTRDNRSDVTGSEGDLTHCYCEAWAFFPPLRCFMGPSPAFHHYRWQIHYSRAAHATERFAKVPGPNEHAVSLRNRHPCHNGFQIKIIYYRYCLGWKGS